MERKLPTYDLTAIKAVLGKVEILAITSSALRDATGPGFDKYAIAELITGIDRRMFYKSMTIFADHRGWQDVYHVPARGYVIYM